MTLNVNSLILIRLGHLKVENISRYATKSKSRTGITNKSELADYSQVANRRGVSRNGGSETFLKLHKRGRGCLNKRGVGNQPLKWKNLR